MQKIPFRRAIEMAAALSAAMSQPIRLRKIALRAIGPYESHGKGGKRPHRSVGTKAYQRAALKLRNKRKAA